MADNKAAVTAVQACIDALVAAWNRHDEKAFAASVAEDADHTNVFGLLTQGRTAIEASHAAIFRTMFKDSALRIGGARMRFLRPDVAVADVRWEMTGARDPQGKDWPKRHGLMNIIAAEDAGAWSLRVFHNQELPPPERIAEIAAMMKR